MGALGSARLGSLFLLVFVPASIGARFFALFSLFFPFSPPARVRAKELTTGTSPNLRDERRNVPIISLQSSPILRRRLSRRRLDATETKFRERRSLVAHRLAPPSLPSLPSDVDSPTTGTSPRRGRGEDGLDRPRTDASAVAGKLADAESIVALKDMFNRVGCGGHARGGRRGRRRGLARVLPVQQQPGGRRGRRPRAPRGLGPALGGARAQRASAPRERRGRDARRVRRPARRPDVPGRVWVERRQRSRRSPPGSTPSAPLDAAERPLIIVGASLCAAPIATRS